MPIYEYRCMYCDHLFENLQNWNEDPPQCPQCGFEVERILSPPSLRFKGTGFHNNDYTRTGPKTR